MPLVVQILRLMRAINSPGVLVLLLILGTSQVFAQPDANNDAFEALTNTETEIDVLANDLLGGEISLELPIQPEHGQLYVTEDQTLLYTSDPLFSGEENFSYTICNTEGFCDAANVSIQVDYSPYCTSLPTLTLTDTIYKMYCGPNSLVEAPSTGYELLQGHVRNYVLHDHPQISQSSAMAVSSSYVIQLSSLEEIETNSVYYITVVTGPDSGFGMVDLESPCSRASEPVPLAVLDCIDAAYTIEYEEAWDYYIIVLGPQGGIAPFDGSNYHVDGTWTGDLAAGETVGITLPLEDCFNLLVSDDAGNSASTFTICPQISDAQSHCLPVYHQVENCDSLNYEVILHLDEEKFDAEGWSLTDNFAIKNLNTETNIGTFAFQDLPLNLGEYMVDFGNGYTFRTEYFVSGSGCFYLFEFGSEDCFPLPPSSSCLSIPGYVPEDLLLVCGSDEIQINTEGQYIGPGDYLTYLLHTADGTELGTLFESNTEGIFSFDSHPLLEKNVTYYVSPGIFPHDNAYLEDCSSIAAGQPIMFIDEANFNINDNFICGYSTEDCENFDTYKEIFIQIDGGVAPYDYVIDLNGETIEGMSFDGNIDLGIYEGIGGDIRMYVSDSEHPCEFYYESLYNFCTNYWSSNTPYIGNMPEGPLYACNQEPILAEAECINNVSSNLLLGYVLHDSYTNELGQVIATSETGEFTAADIGNFEGELYLSGLVINNNPEGLDILLQTEQLVGVYSLAEGTPVLFLENDCDVLVAFSDHIDALSSIEVEIDALANDLIPSSSIANITEISVPAQNGTATVIDNLIYYTANDYFEGQDTFEYTVCTEDGSTCDSAQVQVNVEFNCPSHPGIMPSDPIFVCDASGFSVESIGPDIANGFLLNYILHTSPGLGIGSILARSTDGIFEYPNEAEIVPGAEYYVSAVTGPDDGSGIVDLLTECTVIAAGTAVLFLEPIDLLWSYNYLGFEEIDCEIVSSYELVLFVEGGYGSQQVGSNFELSGDISGFTAADQVFNSTIQAANSDVISVTITDALNCTETFELPVFGNPALQYSNLELQDSETSIAQGENLSVETSCALVTGYADSVLGYVLYTESGNPIGSSIDMNASGNFSASLLDCGAQFFVSAVFGSDDGNGIPNLNNSSFDLIWSNELAVTIDGAAQNSLVLDANELNLPPDSGFTIGTSCIADQGLDNAQLGFVLHSIQDQPVASLLNLNTDGNFTADQLACGLEFFVTGVLAENDGNGLPDLVGSGFEPIWSETTTVSVNNDPISISLNETSSTVPAATDLAVSTDCVLAEGQSSAVVGFVLHSDPNDAQGSLIALNDSGIFNAELLACRNIFYISGVIGDDDGNGLPNLSNGAFDPVWSDIATFEIQDGGQNLTVSPVTVCLSDSSSPCQYDTGVNFGIEITSGIAPYQVSLSIDNGTNIEQTYNESTIDFGYIDGNSSNGFTYNYSLSILDAANNCYELSDGEISCPAGVSPAIIGSINPGENFVCEGEELSISVSCTANWMDNADDYALAYYLHTDEASTSFDMGTIVAVNDNGTFSYTDATGYHGQQLYTSAIYNVIDGNGPSLDALSSLNMTAGPSVFFLENCNLISATNDDTNVEIGASVIINVMENDTHELNESFSISQISGAPTAGSAVIIANEIVYAADDPNYLGEVVMQYMICDNAGNCDTADITITVTSDNNPPIAENDISNVSYSDLIPSEIAIDALDNDTDPNGDQLNLTITNSPQSGSAEVVDGQIVFYPATDTENVTITYSICDSGLPVYCDEATVTVNLTNTNEAPIAANDTVNIIYDQFPPLDTLINVLENDVDPNGDLLTVSITSAIDNGSATIDTEGNILYTLDQITDEENPLIIEYDVCDDAIPSLCDQAALVISVSSTNVAPATVSDTLILHYFDELPEDSTINVLANDSDADSGNITLTEIITQPTVGNAIIEDNGALTYQSADGADGAWMTVVYNVCDDAIPAACTETTLHIRLCQLDSGTDQISISEDLIMGDTYTFDPELAGEILSASAIDNASGGQISFDANGHMNYDPIEIFYGTDNFSITVVSQDGDDCPIANNYNIILNYELNCTADSYCVWPGDTNLDGTANGRDVLPMGIAYNSSGEPRFNASLIWTEQPAANWGSTFENGADYKHADTNGDGTINGQDLDAIYQNYGLSTGKTGSSSSEETVVWLELLTPNPAVYDTVKFLIHLGTEAQPAEDAYGISFGMAYDSTLIDVSSIFTDLSMSWLTADQAEPLNFSFTAEELQFHDMAHSRTDQEALTGYGGIGIIGFVITSKVNIIGKQEVTLEDFQLVVSDLLVIDAYQNPIPVTQIFSTNVGNDPAGIGRENLSINVYPNPSQDIIHVQTSGFRSSEVTSLNLVDVSGKRFDLSNQRSEALDLRINLAPFDAGVYLLEVQTEKGIAQQRIVRY